MYLLVASLEQIPVEHYTKPPIKKNPNAEVVIIHTGANDLRRHSTPTQIATNIMDFVVDVEKNLNQSCDVIISSIISSGDQLQQKVPLDETQIDVVRGLIVLRGFHPAHQQVELVRAMRLRSTRTNRSASCLCQGLDSKLKNLD